MHPCEPSPLSGKVSFLHFHRFCARCVCLLAKHTIVTAFPPAALPAFIGTTQSSDSLSRVCLSYFLSLVRHTLFHVRQNRVSRVAAYSQSPTCHALRPRGGVCNSPVIAAHTVGFRISNSVTLSHFCVFRGSITSAYTYGLLVRSLWTQSSLPGGRLTLTDVGLSPTKINDLARPHYQIHLISLRFSLWSTLLRFQFSACQCG